jgi:chromate transporter
VEQPSLLWTLLLYLRLLTLTFGGGLPIMAAIYTETVTIRKWLSPEKYGTIYALARITPGTNVLAVCAGVAWELLGWPGAIVSVVIANVPAAIVVMLLTQGFDSVRSNRLAMAAVSGMLAAAIGLIAIASWELLQPFFTRRTWLPTVVIAGISFLLLAVLEWPPIAILGLAAVVGLIWRIPE